MPLDSHPPLPTAGPGRATESGSESTCQWQKSAADQHPSCPRNAPPAPPSLTTQVAYAHRVPDSLRPLLMYCGPAIYDAELPWNELLSLGGEGSWDDGHVRVQPEG